MLAEKGLHSEISTRPREYVSIVLGGINDSVELFTSEADFVRAYQVLEGFLSQTRSDGELASASPPEDNRNYFKRTIMLSFFGFVILPLVFNWFATANFLKFLKKKPSASKKYFALCILVAGWIIALGEAYLILKTLKLVS